MDQIAKHESQTEVSSTGLVKFRLGESNALEQIFNLLVLKTFFQNVMPKICCGFEDFVLHTADKFSNEQQILGLNYCSFYTFRLRSWTQALTLNIQDFRKSSQGFSNNKNANYTNYTEGKKVGWYRNTWTKKSQHWFVETQHWWWFDQCWVLLPNSLNSNKVIDPQKADVNKISIKLSLWKSLSQIKSAKKVLRIQEKSLKNM